MLKSILRISFFVFVVLMLGQIQTRNGTIGDVVENATLNAMRWTGQEIAGAKWYASLGAPGWLTHLLSGTAPPEKISKQEKKALEKLLP